MAFTLRIIASLLLAVTCGCGSEGAPGPGDTIQVGETLEVELPAFESAGAEAMLRIGVRSAGGDVAEGARVRFLDTLAVDPMEMERVTLGIPDATVMLDGFASVARTDESGGVEFPWSGGPTLVDASLDDLYCLAAFEAPEDGVLVLRLKDTPALVARVEGGPVPVRLFVASGDGTAVTLAQRLPDPETGLVRFPDPTGGVRLPEGRAVTFSVGCAVVGAETERVPFDPAAPPASPILLRAPATCAAWVECVDERGRPLLADGIATLEAAAAGTGTRHRMMLERGRCRFTAIAPETLLRVTVDALGGPEPAVVVEPGPLAPREDVVVRVRLESPDGKAASSGPPGAPKGGR